MKLSHVLVAIVFFILGVLCVFAYQRYAAPTAAEPTTAAATPTAVAETPSAPMAKAPETAAEKKSAAFRIEVDVNRHGSDYRDYQMEAKAGPELCEKACADDGQCKAFTYVKAGVQGTGPHCWLKNTVPTAYPDNTCVSGVKL
jgi:hypothetical protein